LFLVLKTESNISPHIESRLYGYLMAVAKNINISIIEIGGMPDHVQLLINLSRTISLSETVQ